MRKAYATDKFEIGTFGKPSNDKVNYLVCGYCTPMVAETVRLDEAIKAMEENYDKVNEIMIHEYRTGNTWYF